MHFRDEIGFHAQDWVAVVISMALAYLMAGYIGFWAIIPSTLIGLCIMFISFGK